MIAQHNNTHGWQTADFANLKSEQVDIWSISLPTYRSSLEQFTACLDQEEQAKAARFLVEAARTSFIITRGALRLLLAQYLRVDPKRIVFQQNAYGKLYLDNYPLHFNVSHSRDLAVIGVGRQSPLGVDVEFIDARLDVMELAKRCFTLQEVVALERLPLSQQRQAFFNCWSSKEAVIKAQGSGIFLAMNSFTTPIAFEKHLAGELSLVEAGEATSYWLSSFDPDPQYSGACAVQTQRSGTLRFRNF